MRIESFKRFKLLNMFKHFLNMFKQLCVHELCRLNMFVFKHPKCLNRLNAEVTQP